LLFPLQRLHGYYKAALSTLMPSINGCDIATRRQYWNHTAKAVAVKSRRFATETTQIGAVKCRDRVQRRVVNLDYFVFESCVAAAAASTAAMVSWLSATRDHRLERRTLTLRSSSAVLSLRVWWWVMHGMCDV
jgi:hypothetical protein